MSGPLDDSAWLHQQMAADGEIDDDCADGPIAQAAHDGAVDLDVGAPTADTGLVGDDESPDSAHIDAVSPRFDRRVAARLGGVAATGVVVAIVAAVALYGRSDNGTGSPAPRSVADPAAPAASVAPSPTSDAAADGERPLTFTATADCPPGSTSAQTLAGADPLNAFVCVRDGVDGQVVNVDLGKTYVVSAISITPGWIGQDSSGMSQWAQHRVVTRVQYMLSNGADVTTVTQDTGNVHGEAVQPVKRVLASKITMLILQTSRPPAEAASTSAAPAGLLDGVLGPGDLSAAPSAVPPLAGDAVTSDPVDATFAISNLKIIGHEAI